MPRGAKGAMMVWIKQGSTTGHSGRSDKRVGRCEAAEVGRRVRGEWFLLYKNGARGGAGAIPPRGPCENYEAR